MKRIIGGILGLLGLGLAGAGLYVKANGSSVSRLVIGGADGPTSIFIAGKVGDGPVTALIAAGILLLIAAVIWIVKTGRKDR